MHGKWKHDHLSKLLHGPFITRHSFRLEARRGHFITTCGIKVEGAKAAVTINAAGMHLSVSLQMCGITKLMRQNKRKRKVIRRCGLERSSLVALVVGESMKCYII